MSAGFTIQAHSSSSHQSTLGGVKPLQGQPGGSGGASWRGIRGRSTPRHAVRAARPAADRATERARSSMQGRAAAHRPQLDLAGGDGGASERASARSATRIRTAKACPSHAASSAAAPRRDSRCRDASECDPDGAAPPAHARAGSPSSQRRKRATRSRRYARDAFRGPASATTGASARRTRACEHAPAPAPALVRSTAAHGTKGRLVERRNSARARAPQPARTSAPSSNAAELRPPRRLGRSQAGDPVGPRAPADRVLQHQRAPPRRPASGTGTP